MGQIVKVGHFWIEAASSDIEVAKGTARPDDGEPSTTPVGRAHDVLAELQNAGSRVQETVRAVCETVEEAFEGANRPSELKVKFGLKVSGQAGLVFVGGVGAEGSIEIEATWKNNP